ncbi:MAG: 30S ribosomal protein S17 [Thermodesulfatator sp.]|nr:MAG: 30S ribosomal protein S17 [Thermodesulfatator sp.]
MGKRKEYIGTVVSNKMDKTVVVVVERLVQHPLYKKYIRRRKKFMAHDEGNVCEIGDRVLIEETRPLSRHKRWRVKKILERAPKFEAAAEETSSEEVSQP